MPPFPSLPAAAVPPRPAGPLDEPDRPAETAAAVLARRRAAHAHEVRCAELGAERLRLMSDRLAGPARPHRDRWYAAWRAVADGVGADDRAAVVAALADAASAFRALDRVAVGWRTAARAWLARAKAVDGLFAALAGGWSASYVRLLPHREAELAAAAADAAAFTEWAVTVSAGGPPGERVRAMRGEHPPGVGVPDDALDLLLVFAGGGGAAEADELLGYTAGVGWLGGFTAVVAGAVVPPPPGYRFRAGELPAGEGQRTDAEYLLRLAGWGIESGGHPERFRRRYLGPADPAPRPPADGPAAITAPAAEPVPPAAAAATPDGPAMDPATFALRWGANAVELGNTVEYRLATAVLAARGRYLAVDDLRHQVWGDAEVTDNAIQRAVCRLRRKCADAFGGRLVIDGSQSGHYRIELPPDEGPVRS